MIEFPAKYYDGQSTKAHDVVVRGEPGKPLRIEGLDNPLEFALTEVEVSARLGNTVRSLSLPGGARCESTNQDAVDALARLTGQGRGSALIHRLESRFRWAVAALLFVVLVVVLGFRWGIPWAAERVAMNLPGELAYDLGQGTLAALDRSLFSPSTLGEARQTELRRAFAKLSSKYPELPLSLEFRHGGFPNAFALPDGTVVVTDELVQLAQKDAQLWSVLAHEVGHVHYRHTLRMALESSSVALLASVTLGDATQIVALSGALPALYANSHYSRSHETEADSFALEYLQKNGIAKHHFADMLRLLQSASGPEPKGAVTYLSSHPPTEERVRRFED